MSSSAMEQTRDYSEIIDILDRFERQPFRIISILQEVQDIYRYLPEDVITFIAVEMNMSPAKIFGIVTFYSHFSLKPKGKYMVKVCDGTACHVKGSSKLLSNFQEALGLGDEKITTDDRLFSVETVSCLGACGLAPAVIINEDVYGQVMPKMPDEMIETIRTKESENDGCRS